ncbi:MAG: prolipoprotein diacylglyceryl transferase [Spirochaetaceae bacterium]|nr:MAG: prolipoprotein diacylglyceryl transferase [Spirochaetaceae bacterium]
MLYIDYPSWLSPVIIPGLPLRWYGLMYLVAFGVTYLMTTYQLRDRRLAIAGTLTQDDVMNLFFWTILGLLIGARIFAATIYDTTGRYLTRPWLIFWPFDENMNFTGLQGMSYHGGLVGAIVAGVTYCKVKKIDVLEMADIGMTAVPLGYTFGRLGNFINGELYGRITAAPWGVRFPNAQPVPTAHPAARMVAEQTGIDITGQSFVNLPRHPSQLYEAALEGVVLWAVMWFIFRKRKPFKGFMIGVYLIGYALARYIAEYFRTPDAGLGFIIQLGPSDNPGWLFLSPLNITTGQVLSLLMALAGVLVLVGLRIYARTGARVETFETMDTAHSASDRNARRRARKRINRPR